MKRIDQLVLPGNLQIDVLFENGKLAYTFTHNEKQYGNAVQLPSKKVADIVAASMVLFTNALETKAELDKNQ
jgi:hypothetical protein